MTDALQEAIDMVVRDKEKHYAGILPAEDMLVAYIKVNALAAIAQAEQLKRIADALEETNKALYSVNPYSGENTSLAEFLNSINQNTFK